MEKDRSAIAVTSTEARFLKIAAVLSTLDAATLRNVIEDIKAQQADPVTQQYAVTMVEAFLKGATA